MDDITYRKAIGKRLQTYRESLGITRYRVAKNGDLPPKRVKDVEDGDSSYTIDTFFAYLRGCDLDLHIYSKESKKSI